MSEQQPETVVEPEGIELPPQGDAAFGALMDALAPETDELEAKQSGETPAAPATGDGQTAPAGESTPAKTGSAVPAALGADGKPATPDAGQPAADAVADAAGRDRPAEWTTSSADLAPKFGELSTALEEVTAKAYHSEALEGVRTEHAKYFEVLEQHPRLLIGQEVPKIGGAAGEMETLRDASDAAEWQEAVKTVLVEEVRDRASRAMEDNSGFLTTLHQSIELFQNNNDLVPGTKEFDVELADKFATLMQPYEVRVEDKFQGYSIPVQPIINQLRTDLTAARAANPAAAEVVPDKDKPVTKQDEPQAGLQSKAGSDADTEDFSTLFGTLGLPNLRI